MAPPRVVVVQVGQRGEFDQVEQENTLPSSTFESHKMIQTRDTYDTNQRSSNGPTEFEPTSWIVADHIVETFVETVDAKNPRNGDALEEDDPQQN